MRATWYQTKSTLYVSLQFDNVVSDKPPSFTVTAETLEIKFEGDGGIAFEAAFSKPILVEDDSGSAFIYKGGGKVDVVAKKAGASRGHWPRPFQIKYPWVKPNWDRWIDEDDDNEPDIDVSDAPAAASSNDDGAGAVPPDSADAMAAAERVRNMGFATESELTLDDEKAWLTTDWPTFKMEERMLTMATFWNAMSAETRVTAAKRLLVVLKMGDAALAALESKMKGGDWGTYKLDTSNYVNNGVKLPRGWVEAFEEKAVAQQVEVMELCFGKMPIEEQKVVASTFM